MSDDLRSDLEAAATEQTEQPTNSTPFDEAAAMDRIHSAMAAWEQNPELLAKARSAYPRVQNALDGGDLENIIMRGLGTMLGTGGKQGWLVFLNGNPVTDMRTLDREIRDQERSGDVSPQEQRHMARDRQLAHAERLVRALAELKAGASMIATRH